MTAKERHKKKMVEYWANPGNDFVNRKTMAQVLGISLKTFYLHFTPEEMTAIECKAEKVRRTKYARERNALVMALYREGKGGNVSAAKEFLDRTEGKVADKVQGDLNINIKLIDSYGAK